MPEDMLKFGLIPEFIGRLPVITTVRSLNRDAPRQSKPLRLEPTPSGQWTVMFQLIATVFSVWLWVALLFKGFLDRPFVSCLIASWCFLHLLWILVREPRY